MPRSRKSSRTDPSRRGFAMVLVVLLTLVVGLGIAILFQRHGVASLAARRQADDYIARHAGLGMRELISRWLSTVRGKVADSIEGDGFAFTLEFSDGQRIDVYMRDAQGTSLADTSALTGRRREIVELMKFYLEQTPLEDQQHLLRRHGPSEICIASAPPEVLLALAQAIVGPERAEDVAEALSERRDERFDRREGTDSGSNIAAESAAAEAIERATGGASPGGGANGRGGMNSHGLASVDQVLRVLSEENVDPGKIAEFRAMLVAAPTLWFVTAELKGVGGKVVDRAGGLIELEAGRTDPFNQNGPFLTWETLPLDEGLGASVSR